ncbi:protein of unknown function [Microlunatus sagamiharensis]|uniref:DUF885 domain-containing protein n=2 Tax=Microlunatus sagamiharensis TaxID=546874 RepID=A0A1H2MN28_9ACTN|nr:protein of unknown function [Microlunatus sagamiharensis]
MPMPEPTPRPDARLRRVADLDASYLREYSGLHEEYDGRVADLSPAGVEAMLGRLGGPAYADPVDERQVAATEHAMSVRFGRLQQHRRDPWVHVEALDLSQYERGYAPAEDRRRAREEHLGHYPDLVSAALASLDLVPAPVAGIFAPAVRGLAAGLADDDGDTASRARTALATLGRRLEELATGSEVPVGIGPELLEELLSCEDEVRLDTGTLADLARSEYDRMEPVRVEAEERLARELGVPQDRVLAAVLDDHGDFDAVLADTATMVARAARFAAERELIARVEDDCRVEASPPARRFAAGRVSWRAPWESCGGSYFHITPPSPAFTPAEVDRWLSRFNRPAMTVMAVHEIAPGHASHALMMADAATTVRRTLWSELFFEGWAHYAEEMVWEEGYGAGSAAYQHAMALDAQMRAVRVEAVLAIHAGGASVAEATALFEERTFLSGPAAHAEALRCAWEPSCTRYTVGKVAFRNLRESASRSAGRPTLRAFHDQLLALGSPPVGLAADVLGLDCGLPRRGAA